MAQRFVNGRSKVENHNQLMLARLEFATAAAENGSSPKIAKHEFNRVLFHTHTRNSALTLIRQGFLIG